MHSEKDAILAVQIRVADGTQKLSSQNSPKVSRTINWKGLENCQGM